MITYHTAIKFSEDRQDVYTGGDGGIWEVVIKWNSV